MDDVRAYYASYGERERLRLERAEGVIEWTVTTELLNRHLPTGGHVLDLGGGPGRYASWLLARGHQVTLADLSPELLDIARSRLPSLSATDDVEPAKTPKQAKNAKQAKSAEQASIVEADARDLSRWADETFDAVISLGPFYHLTEPADRDRAAREVVRVARPGSIVAIAMMPWYGYLRRTLSVPDERRHLADPAFLDDLQRRGTFRNDIPGRFTHGYGFRPAEISPYFEGFGLRTVTLASTHGYASGIEGDLVPLRDSDPVAYEAGMRLLIETAEDPSLFGTAGHLLYIGRKAPASSTSDRNVPAASAG